MHRIRNLLARLRRRCCCRRRIVLVDVSKQVNTEGGPVGLIVLKPGARLKHVRLVDVDVQFVGDCD
jgi:hypothetical protein